MWYDNYIDNNSEIILDDKAVFNLLYEGVVLDNVKCKPSKDLEIYNSIIDEYDLNISKLQFASSTDNKKEFIQKCLNNWFVPEKYTHMDPYHYIRNLTKTQQESQKREEQNLREIKRLKKRLDEYEKNF